VDDVSGVEVPPAPVQSSVLTDDACSVSSSSSSSSSSPAPFLALSTHELSDFCVLQSFRAHADTPRILTNLPPVSDSPLLFDEFFVHACLTPVDSIFLPPDAEISCNATLPPHLTPNSTCDSSPSSSVVIKFDSACSRNMSGVPTRLHPDTLTVSAVQIRGFNDSVSAASHIGVNEDGLPEYFVGSMPPHLALLCANAYAQQGAAILFPEDGCVVQLNDSERQALRDFLRPFPHIKHLRVRDRTYEVHDAPVPPLADVFPSQPHHTDTAAAVLEVAHATANRYFNSKINVTDQQERVLAHLLTGMSFRDTKKAVEHNSIIGLPRDVTVHALHRYERLYGTNPPVLQLATPNLASNRKGYHAPLPQLTHVGQRVEADFMESEFNDTVPHSTSGTTPRRVRKLATHGGAIAAFVAIDSFSGHVYGHLVSSLANAVEQVTLLHNRYRIAQHTISLFAADQGILAQSHFQVMTPAVEAFLASHHIASECSMPYTHNLGTSRVERTIRTIKELTRFALLYVLGNPHFQTFGFTRVQILRLWGELFYWAITIINLKASPADPTRTKHEVYFGRKPDLRETPLLPIFASVYVLRNGVGDPLLNSIRPFWQRGLYCGPSRKTVGAVRVAVISTNGRVHIITTCHIKSISDGGDNDPYATADQAVREIFPVPPVNVSTPVPPSTSIAPSTILPTRLSSSASSVSTTTTPVVAPLPVHPDSHSSVPSSSVQVPLSTPASPLSTPTAPTSSTSSGVPKPSRRSTRHRRPAKIHSAATFLHSCAAHTFKDWSTCEDDIYFLSFSDSTVISITSAMPPPADIIPSIGSLPTEQCYRAVKGPPTFKAALADPNWHEAAEKEFRQVISEDNTVVSFDPTQAKQLIAAGEAQVLYLIPVYEEKVKDSVLVRKVRLVADGRAHTMHGATYAATPSRCELFTLLHLFAAHNLDYFHVDEIRAFLSAKRQDDHVVFARLRGDAHYWKILNALYGMKTASRDHQIATVEKLFKLGFVRCGMCNCIFQYKKDSVFVLVYCYVDDFIFGGKSTAAVSDMITHFRSLANTTEPILNADLIIGMEVSRMRDRRIVLIRMTARIRDLVKRFPYAILKKNGEPRVCEVPMPMVGYIVDDSDFELLPEPRSRFLSPAESAVYLSIVGCLIWIQGVRHDIIFAVLYLSWFTKKPRSHHLDMAEYVISYLNTSINIPLVLGGDQTVSVTGYTDASLATGPKSRSITGEMVKLNDAAGSVSSKATASHTVLQSSFEAELYGLTNVIKSVNATCNLLDSLEVEYIKPCIVYTDNEAMMKFANGEGAAKGVRHMDMRLWYTRDEIARGKVSVLHMFGNRIPTDKLTKLANVGEHRVFTRNIQGLDLVGLDFYG
jgi:hypothetical protein